MLIMESVPIPPHAYFFRQILVFHLIILFSSPLVGSSSQQSDRSSLLAFKSQIEVDPLGALSLWNDSLQHCHWQGITCNHRRRVTNLDLPSLNLEGTLSPHIGNLTFLGGVNLTENHFHGEIPQEIGRLFRLQYFIIESNSFDGKIPSNITHCSHLREINFIDNKLSGNILTELSFLSKLESLYLSRNDFSGSFPSSLGNLTYLTALSLRQNQLVGSIPNDLCHTQSLEFFQVGDNNLTGEVPSCLYNLSSLIYLSLQTNQLAGRLPPDIGLKLPNIQDLYLSTNNFNGQIPISLFSAPKIQTIDLSFNSFIGEIPTNLTSCHNLRTLGVAYNLLSGKIPALFPIHSKLDILYLDHNNFIGNIPSPLSNLSSLTVMSLPSNRLEGSIPELLCQIQSLELFDVSINNLTGTFPLCLYNLSNIYYIGAAANELTGSLPPNIGLALPSIQDLYLGGNQFSGLIPISLTNTTTLEVLELAYNSFTGPIPKDLGRSGSLRLINFNSNQLGTKEGNDLEFIDSLTNCSNLIFLGLALNSLSGPLPESISSLSTKITTFDASTNNIHGNIPVGIQNLINLEKINLENNYLSGNIPIVIGKLNNLREIYFNGNKLFGPIPASLSNLTQLLRLKLSFNNLSGNILPTLANCKSLVLLDLSHNKLVGKIPKQLSSLSLLTVGLFLNHNFFTGSLPSQIGNLTNIVHLDVSENNLSGHLPETLGNCLSLERLYLHRNFFQGEIPKTFNALQGLLYFNLSQNNLSGEIPEFLERFPLLYLNLSYNQFEGRVPIKGAFGNASAISVVENNKLCGGIKELKLPSCIQKVKKTSLSSKVVLTLIVGSIGLFLFLFFLLICYRRKKLNHVPPAATLFDRSYERLTYSELFKATNGFANDTLIGSGSYGSVFKGTLENTNQIVAVKVLNLEKHGASKSFLTECNALKNLRHRNLLKILTSCSSIDFQGNDFRALVLEFMTNGSLEEWLHPREEQQFESRKFSFTRRMSIATDVASALAYLHHNSPVEVIHCDIKPSNVLLDDDMVGHVADFGIAKIFTLNTNNSTQSLTMSTAIKGSIGYVAPEYGMGGHVSMQGDVYSYGILLLEMFTGKRPTDDMFVNGLSLHSYAKTALPTQVMDIADPLMILEENFEELDSMGQKNGRAGVHECLVQIISLGVVCSAESLVERVTMSEVVTKLYHIMEHYKHVRSIIE